MRKKYGVRKKTLMEPHGKKTWMNEKKEKQNMEPNGSALQGYQSMRDKTLKLKK